MTSSNITPVHEEQTIDTRSPFRKHVDGINDCMRRLHQSEQILLSPIVRDVNIEVQLLFSRAQSASEGAQDDLADAFKLVEKLHRRLAALAL